MNINISVDELKKHKIFIGTPMYGGNCSGSYTKSCTDLAMMCAANGITIKFYYLFNESLIQRARNYVADEFMRSDCTHLVFIDSDIAFNPKYVLGLLAVQLKDPGVRQRSCRFSREEPCFMHGGSQRSLPGPIRSKHN